MINYKGIAINNLLAMGPLKKFSNNDFVPKKEIVEDADKEIENFNAAIDSTREILEQLCETQTAEGNDEAAEIIEVQVMMLEDEGYITDITDMISSDKVCSSYAVYEVGNSYAKMFEAMDNEYMQARSADVLDISRRIIRVINGVEGFSLDSKDKVVLVADELGPSDTVKLEKDCILAFVTKKGSDRSHTAILARSMGIPALVVEDMDLDSLFDGMFSIVDGENASFIIEPDDELIEEFDRRLFAQDENNKELETYRDLPSETKSGKKITICANIGCVEDAKAAVENGSEGIGLFRSEFLYIGRDSAPSEEEQFEAYKAVLELFGEKPVVVRTLDIGADKKADYLNLPEEENPALGLRGIRICLTNKELFKVQLRALLRAAVYGNLHVMYPMIISEKEIDDIYAVVNEVEQELIAAKVEYKIPVQGIMIETPAAVIMSETLAKKVSFFSIGTNDLTQYTLAIDRQSKEIDAFYDPHHPAILSMIKTVAENAHKAGIWVGICGALGEDLTETFLEYGIDELSVVPSAVTKIRKVVRNIE